MKKLKTILRLNAIVYWSLYIFKTFVIWKLKNPFQWLVDIPDYTNTERLNLLMMLLIIVIMDALVAFIGLDENGKF